MDFIIYFNKKIDLSARDENADMLRPMKAFDYLFDKVDGVIVGITSLQELNELLNAAGKYFGRTHL